MSITLILLMVTVFYNSWVARNIGQNGLLWGFITAVVFILCSIFLGTVYMLILFKGVPTRAMMEAFKNGHYPLAEPTVALLGTGGALIIRYVLEQMKKKKPKA